jgi:hypothetical protein
MPFSTTGFIRDSIPNPTKKANALGIVVLNVNAKLKKVQKQKTHSTQETNEKF